MTLLSSTSSPPSLCKEKPISPVTDPDQLDPVFVRRVHMWAGVIAGAAGVLAGHPLDTVKVRLQVQPRQKSKGHAYRGTFHCFQSIVRREGFAGLYKGLTSPLACLTAVNAIVFGVQGNVMRYMDDKKSLSSHFIAGCMAGIAQSAIAAPSDRLKLLMQLQYDKEHTLYRSPIHAAKNLIKNKQGYLALQRGYLATLARDMPAFGIYFASYEWFTQKMTPNGKVEELTCPQLLLAGGCAGMLSWLFNYPTDVIKTRFQADDSYTSYKHCIRELYANGGKRAFFAGLGSTMIRAFPYNAATFFTAEWTYRLLLDLNILGIGKAGSDRRLPHVSVKDIWNLQCTFLLPEAGSTHLDPAIHGCRFQ